MTRTRIVMPQLGESVHEGTISRWLIKPGERIEEFQSILEVDTDKVSAEVPSPVSGVVMEIIAKEGETIAVGRAIAVVDIDTPPAQPNAAGHHLRPWSSPVRSGTQEPRVLRHRCRKSRAVRISATTRNARESVSQRLWRRPRCGRERPRYDARLAARLATRLRF